VLLRSQKQRIVKDTKGACSAGALRRIEFAVWLIVTRRETIERIVATKWINDRPMVFKASKNQAHGRQGRSAIFN
jgi:hypothetical protein